jgi:hypothetical protein
MQRQEINIPAAQIPRKNGTKVSIEMIETVIVVLIRGLLGNNIDATVSSIDLVMR